MVRDFMDSIDIYYDKDIDVSKKTGWMQELITRLDQESLMGKEAYAKAMGES